MAHDLPTIAFICIRNYAIIATRFPAPKCMLQIRKSRCENGRAKVEGESLSHHWFAILSVVRNYWFITRRHSGCGSLDDSDSWVNSKYKWYGYPFWFFSKEYIYKHTKHYFIFYLRQYMSTVLPCVWLHGTHNWGARNLCGLSAIDMRLDIIALQ